MDHERKRFSFRQIAVTLGLLCVLLLLVWLEISIFISGPSIHYDDKITAQKETILTEHKTIKELDRHVFAYVIYSGKDQENYYWFNENGELLTWRALKQIDKNQALKIAKDTYQMEDCEVLIGYGYEKPVYRIENNEFELYLDIDTNQQVFFRKKAEGTK